MEKNAENCRWWMIIYIAFLDMFVPLSTDLYLPALSQMRDYFQTTEQILSLTLTVYFFVYGVGVLIFGPLSDKFGRKPTLLFGLTLFTLSSLLCACVTSPYQLLACRVFQALGAGSLLTVTTATVKDCFEGRAKNRMYAIIQTMTVIAPILAPIIGAGILMFFSWRYVFIVLSMFGVIGLIAGMMIKETLPEDEKITCSILQSFGRLLKVAKNPGFSLYLMVFAIASTPFMAYLTMAPYIYMDCFHLSPQKFSFYFSSTTILSAVGAMFYMKICRTVDHRKLINSCLLMSLCSGILLIFLGGISPLMFVFCWAPFKLSGGIMRPCNAGILMEQQDGDSGSAAALINAAFMICGSLAITVLSPLKTGEHRIETLSTIVIAISSVVLVAWLILQHSKIKIKGLVAEKPPIK